MKILNFFAAACLTLAFASSAEATIDRFQVVNPKLIRGGQPTELSDFDYLKRIGVKTIITLRTTPEQIRWEKQVSNARGLQHRSYPINGMSYPSADTVRQVLRDLQDPALQPVFLHCHAGKDRTGLVMGLYRVHHDVWHPMEAYSEMLRIGFEPELQGLRQFFWDHLP